MRRFNSIKKSRKKSEDIDEKIEYLDKECQKTGLQEVMKTTGIYQGTSQEPNTERSDFEGLSQDGFGLGLSGADGNSVGGASIGDVSGLSGVALSPPHPVTGVRRSANHVRDGLGGTTPLRPGVTITRGFSDNPPPYTMGSCLWFFDADHDNGVGQPLGKWCNLEWSNFEGSTKDKWGFWDTVKEGQFAGVFFFNTNLSQHPCGDIGNLISGIGFGINGAIGASQIPVFFQNDLGDSSHLPIDIDGMSPQAFNYLRGRAIASGANYDLYNWILKTYGMPAAEWYLKTGRSQGNPYLPGGAYVPRADAGKPVSDTDIPGDFAGYQDGDEIALFGGKKDKTPKKPTKKTSRGATEAQMAIEGGYGITPEQFFQKYGISPQDYQNLPQY